MKQSLVTLLMLLSLVATSSAEQPHFESGEAWMELETVLLEQYVYLNDAGFDARAMLFRNREKAKLHKTKESFLDFAQQVVRQFHDPHLNLSPFDKRDFAIVPTGSDIWAVEEKGHYLIEDVKAGGAADLAGLRPGIEVLKIDGSSVPDVMERALGLPIEKLSRDQRSYALNVALAGTRRQPRKLEIRRKGRISTVNLPPSYDHTDALKEGPPVSHQRYGNIGHIRFQNSMGRDDTVAAFRKSLNTLSDCEALIIDLRNIPSGGNTGVARPILGHFVKKETLYQRYQTQEPTTPYYEMPYLDDKIQPVAPYWDKPVVVLVGRWTGSMGEGMAVGFDAIGVRAIIGAPMADLLGAVTGIELPTSGGRLELGIGRVYQANGELREDFVPPHLVIPADRGAEGGDPALSRALQLLIAGQPRQIPPKSPPSEASH